MEAGLTTDNRKALKRQEKITTKQEEVLQPSESLVLGTSGTLEEQLCTADAAARNQRHETRAKSRPGPLLHSAPAWKGSQALPHHANPCTGEKSI